MLGGHAILPAEMQGLLAMKNLTLAYMKGWMYVTTMLSEPKFLGCIDNQLFLPMVHRCAHFARVRAPLTYNVIMYCLFTTCMHDAVHVVPTTNSSTLFLITLFCL